MDWKEICKRLALIFFIVLFGFQFINMKNMSEMLQRQMDRDLEEHYKKVSESRASFEENMLGSILGIFVTKRTMNVVSDGIPENDPSYEEKKREEGMYQALDVGGQKQAAYSSQESEFEQFESDTIEESEEGVPFITVDDSYFDTAAFIGDSRTVGMYEYGGLENATFYCCSGLTLYDMFNEPTGKFKDGTWDKNIEDGLFENDYEKVYIMVGINELGTGSAEQYAEDYKEMIEHVKGLQPGAKIFIQSIMSVTKERSEKGDYITKEEIEKRNEKIAELADNKTVFYLDVNSALCDEEGYLNSEYTFDGVHLTANYVVLWLDYLKNHAISIDF